MHPKHKLTPRRKIRSNAAGLSDDRNHMFGSKCLAAWSWRAGEGFGPWEKRNLGNVGLFNSLQHACFRRSSNEIVLLCLRETKIQSEMLNDLKMLMLIIFITI